MTPALLQGRSTFGWLTTGLRDLPLFTPSYGPQPDLVRGLTHAVSHPVSRVMLSNLTVMAEYSI